MYGGEGSAFRVRTVRPPEKPWCLSIQGISLCGSGRPAGRHGLWDFPPPVSLDLACLPIFLSKHGGSTFLKVLGCWGLSRVRAGYFPRVASFFHLVLNPLWPYGKTPALLSTQCRHGVSTQQTLITAPLEAVQCHASHALKKMIKTFNKALLSLLTQHHPNCTELITAPDRSGLIGCECWLNLLSIGV